MIDHRDAAPLTSGRAVIDHVGHHSRSILEEVHEGQNQSDVAIWEQGDDAFTTPAMNTHFLAIVLGGSAMVDLHFDACTGPKQARVTPGSLCYVPAGNASSIAFEGRIRTAHVMLSAELIAMELEDVLGESGVTVAFAGFLSEHNPAIAADCLDLIKQHSVRDASDLARSGLEHTLAQKLVRIACPTSGTRKAAEMLSGIQIKQAVDYIEDRVCEDFVLAELAAHVAATVPTLIRSFEEEVGLTPASFHAERRIDYVRAWIRQDSKMAPLDLARMAGFHSFEELDQVFRNVMGVGLENYRKGALS